MEREFVAQNVRNKLHDAEAATEAAVRSMSLLLAELYSAKADLGLSATVGAEETTRISRGLGLLQAAHTELVGSHHGLEVLGRALKLRTRSDAWKPMPKLAQASSSDETVRAA